MKNAKNNQLNDDLTRFTFRLPGKIHERIKEIAKRKKKSVNFLYNEIAKYYLVNTDKSKLQEADDYWDGLFDGAEKIEDDENLRLDDLEYVKDEIKDTVSQLRHSVDRIENRLASFEARYYAAKLYYISNKKKDVDISLRQINLFANQIKHERVYLDDAKEYLKYFRKIDPDNQYEYTQDLENKKNSYAGNSFITHRINTYIKENLEEVLSWLVGANELNTTINKSFYYESHEPIKESTVPSGSRMR